MSDIYGDLREIKERLTAAEGELHVRHTAQALVEVRKAINIADEWLEDE